MFAAIVFVLTAYIHVPSFTGYVHVGDAVIYLAACLLPLPYAAFAGACGACLADCLSGYAIWAPGTAIIKIAIVFLFVRKNKKILCTRNICALFLAAVVNVGGYYLYESIITANFAAPVVSLLPNAIQSILSGVLFVALALIAQRVYPRFFGEKQ